MSKGTIKLEQVSKRFKRGHRSGAAYTTLKSLLFSSRKSAAASREFHALDDVSLCVEPGASLGVIGRNGSGKSSLLKLIAGIYRPDSGKIKIKGRVSALIELGAGFHPEFTGRENIYLGGAMFGLTRKEVDRVFPDILDFAELPDVIDEPVRTYSSGMFMRLGFSLAVHTQPDILLVDEVLSVGDAPFVSKCKDKILELRKQGVTLLLVSHDLHAVQSWCDEVLWLHKGKVKLRGSPNYVIDSYLDEVQTSEKEALEAEQAKLEELAASSSESNPADSEEPSRWGSKEIEITGVEILKEDGTPTLIVHSEDKFRVRFNFKCKNELESACFGVGIYRADGMHVFGSNTLIDKTEVDLKGVSEGVCEFSIGRLSLAESSYLLDVAVHDEDGRPYDYHHFLHKFSVKTKSQHIGVISPDLRWSIDAS